MKTSLVSLSHKSVLHPALLAFVVLLTAVVGSAQPRPMRPRTAALQTGDSTVKGRVVYKDNGQPLKSTRVRIFTTSDEIGNGGLVAFTNPQGEFQVDKLAAGKYYVALEGPGMAMQSGFGMRLPIPMSAIPRREDFEEIVPKHDAEFTVDGTNTVEVEVKVVRGGTISGRVLKANGAGVENVPVNFISREGLSGGPYTARFSAQTGKDGAYKIENIPPGEYIVSAAVENKSGSFDVRARLRGESQVVTFHPAAASVRDSLPIKVEPARETSGVNITLVTRNSFRVSGTVVQQRDATPLAGATVLLRNKEAELGGSLMPGMGQRTTRADSEGRWAFDNVMEGSYEVTALSPLSPTRPDMGGAAPTDREEAFRRSRQRFLVSQQELTVAGADLDGVLMSISGPGSIVGRVEVDNGDPLPSNLVIFLELAGPGHRPGPPLPVRVRPDGTFTFGNVQGGEVFVGVALPPDSKYFIKAQTANGEDLRTSAVKVIEGAEAGPLRVVLSSGNASLAGRVVSSTNQGVSDVVVLLAPADANGQRFRTAYLTTRTTADGSYSVSGAPGDYVVFARRRDELPAIVSPEFVKNQAATATRVTLGAGEQKLLDLRLP